MSTSHEELYGSPQAFQEYIESVRHHLEDSLYNELIKLVDDVQFNLILRLCLETLIIEKSTLKVQHEAFRDSIKDLVFAVGENSGSEIVELIKNQIKLREARTNLHFEPEDDESIDSLEEQGSLHEYYHFLRENKDKFEPQLYSFLLNEDEVRGVTHHLMLEVLSYLITETRDKKISLQDVNDELDYDVRATRADFNFLLLKLDGKISEDLKGELYSEQYQNNAEMRRAAFASLIVLQGFDSISQELFQNVMSPSDSESSSTGSFSLGEGRITLKDSASISGNATIESGTSVLSEKPSNTDGGEVSLEPHEYFAKEKLQKLKSDIERIHSSEKGFEVGKGLLWGGIDLMIDGKSKKVPHHVEQLYRALMGFEENTVRDYASLLNEARATLQHALENPGYGRYPSTQRFYGDHLDMINSQETPNKPDTDVLGHG